MSITADNAIFDARVKKGATKLDAMMGRDWRNDIDPTTLSLTSGTLCVLGQIYGDYHGGLAKLGLSSVNNDAHDYGFTTLDSGDPSNSKIKAAWMRLLSFKDGEVVQGDSWNAAWSFIRIEKMVRVLDKTYYVIQPGDVTGGEFKADRYEALRVCAASNVTQNYKRWAPAPKVGSIVKTEDGEIYYIGKDNMAWLISDTAASWIGVNRLMSKGGVTVLKTTVGTEFNTTEK